MNIFGKIEGRIFGDYVRIDRSHNSALVELLLGQQAKETLDKAASAERRIVIFRGHDGDGEYMGWRTGTRQSVDPSLEIVAEHAL